MSIAASVPTVGAVDDDSGPCERALVLEDPPGDVTPWLDAGTSAPGAVDIIQLRLEDAGDALLYHMRLATRPPDDGTTESYRYVLMFQVVVSGGEPRLAMLYFVEAPYVSGGFRLDPAGTVVAAAWDGDTLVARIPRPTMDAAVGTTDWVAGSPHAWTDGPHRSAGMSGGAPERDRAGEPRPFVPLPECADAGARYGDRSCAPVLVVEDAEGDVEPRADPLPHEPGALDFLRIELEASGDGIEYRTTLRAPPPRDGARESYRYWLLFQVRTLDGDVVDFDARLHRPPYERGTLVANDAQRNAVDVGGIAATWDGATVTFRVETSVLSRFLGTDAWVAGTPYATNDGPHRAEVPIVEVHVQGGMPHRDWIGDPGLFVPVPECPDAGSDGALARLPAPGLAGALVVVLAAAAFALVRRG